MKVPRYRWTLWVCPYCGDADVRPGEHAHEPFRGDHIHERVAVDVVAEDRAKVEAAAAALNQRESS